jgi:proline iminopeptidase
MPAFTAHDGTELAYRRLGQGDPVVCLPGGPMQDCAYLGDLGGLSEHLDLILPDPRGTGRSATPADPASYRCDRLVDDVEALLDHLGLERATLLGHSAGANIAALYTAARPERVDRLVLVTPSAFALGVRITAEARREVVRLREGEPWYGPAAAAFERISAGQATDDDWTAIAPFTYGRWDAETQAHHVRGRQRRNDEAAAVFGSEGAFDPPATRAALAAFDAPVLLVGGEVDLTTPPSVLAGYVDLFPRATLTVLPGAAHFPWLDDPAAFTTAVAAFLASRRS